MPVRISICIAIYVPVAAKVGRVQGTRCDLWSSISDRPRNSKSASFFSKKKIASIEEWLTDLRRDFASKLNPLNGLKVKIIDDSKLKRQNRWKTQTLIQLLTTRRSRSRRSDSEISDQNKKKVTHSRHTGVRLASEPVNKLFQCLACVCLTNSLDEWQLVLMTTEWSRMTNNSKAKPSVRWSSSVLACSSPAHH